MCWCAFAYKIFAALSSNCHDSQWHHHSLGEFALHHKACDLASLTGSTRLCCCWIFFLLVDALVQMLPWQREWVKPNRSCITLMLLARSDDVYISLVIQFVCMYLFTVICFMTITQSLTTSTHDIHIQVIFWAHCYYFLFYDDNCYLVCFWLTVLTDFVWKNART